MSTGLRLLARARPSVYSKCATNCRTMILSRKKVPARPQTAAPGAPQAAAATAFEGKDLAIPEPLFENNIEEQSKFAHQDLLDAFNEPDADADAIASLRGLGSRPFDQTVASILLAPLEMSEIEITPEGLLYLPEIRYRRILNRAFGPGGWGLAPRGKPMVTGKQVSREYVLICLGRAVSVARGERDFFADSGVHTAIEGCKSNALMRCCKDLGIASELWDPTFIRKFKSKYCEMSYNDKRRKSLWKLK